VAASALGILALSYAGVWLFALALIAAPLIMGLSWWAAQSAPKALAGLILGGVCAILVVAAPLTACFSIAAVLSGLLLPAFLARRPDEDDCYYLIPVLYLATLAGLFGIDRLARSHGAWEQFQSAFGREVVEAQAAQDAIVAQMPLPAEEPARWRQANRLLPFRATGVSVAAAGLVFYAATAFLRRWLAAVQLTKNRFIYFRVKEIYLSILIAGLAAQAFWILKPWPLMGHVAFGLLFFSGAALLLEAISLAVFFFQRAERPNAGLAAGAGVAVALLAAPILALPCAAVGLADVWLDFRKLDRILREVHQ